MWTTEASAGKPADLFEPSARPRFVLLFLHDLDGQTLAASPPFTELLEKNRLACICPHGQQSWWTDRVSPDFDLALAPEAYLLEQVLPFCAQRWGLRPPAIGLTGIGMGGQGALRLAFRQPKVFPVVAGIAAALDCYELYGFGTPLDLMYDSKEQCRQDTALLHLHPSHFPPHIFYCIDPDDRTWYRGNDRLHEKMSALGIEHAFDGTSRAGGHSWNYFHHQAARVLQFLLNGLHHESRRLL